MPWIKIFCGDWDHPKSLYNTCVMVGTPGTHGSGLALDPTDPGLWGPERLGIRISLLQTAALSLGFLPKLTTGREVSVKGLIGGHQRLVRLKPLLGQSLWRLQHYAISIILFLSSEFCYFFHKWKQTWWCHSSCEYVNSYALSGPSLLVPSVLDAGIQGGIFFLIVSTLQ